MRCRCLRDAVYLHVLERQAAGRAHERHITARERYLRKYSSHKRGWSLAQVICHMIALDQFTRSNVISYASRQQILGAIFLLSDAPAEDLNR